MFARVREVREAKAIPFRGCLRDERILVSKNAHCRNARLPSVSIAVSVDWVTILWCLQIGPLFGGPFMGLTALGLMSGRALGRRTTARVIGLTTASWAQAYRA